MVKHIVRWCYWLGMLSFLLAILTRVLDMFGLFPILMRGEGYPISSNTFVNLSVVLFLAAIAATCYAWTNSQKP